MRCDLETGKYTVLTFTSGCGLPITKSSTGAQKKLVKKKPGGSADQYTLTKEFKLVINQLLLSCVYCSLSTCNVERDISASITHHLYQSENKKIVQMQIGFIGQH